MERVNPHTKQIRLNINLENWDKDKLYDRVGLNEETLQILDTEITKNNSCKTRTKCCSHYRSRAMNYRFKYNGINTAEEFNQRLNEEILKKVIKARRTRTCFLI